MGETYWNECNKRLILSKVYVKSSVNSSLLFLPVIIHSIYLFPRWSVAFFSAHFYEFRTCTMRTTWVTYLVFLAFITLTMINFYLSKYGLLLVENVRIFDLFSSQVARFEFALSEISHNFARYCDTSVHLVSCKWSKHSLKLLGIWYESDLMI